MLGHVIEMAVRGRWLALVLVAAMGALGVYSALRLPIDAVPDITNVQVQINTEAPGYSPLETEQRITYLIENVMAGLPHLSYTRSISRYGLSQVTVVFEDGTDIHSARQRVAERLQEARSQLPPDVEPSLGPIATGLGEVLMFVLSRKPDARIERGINEGEPDDETDLRTVMNWIVRPQLGGCPVSTEVNPIGGYADSFVA